MAAVNCRMSLIFPPSMSSPQRIPPMAGANPRRVARSGLEAPPPLALWVALAVCFSAILGLPTSKPNC